MPKLETKKGKRYIFSFITMYQFPAKQKKRKIEDWV